MYLEYDWTFGVWRPRFGDTFTDVRGWRSFADLNEAKWALYCAGLRLGRRTDTRVWEITAITKGAK